MSEPSSLWSGQPCERTSQLGCVFPYCQCDDPKRIKAIRAESPDHLEGGDWMYWPLKFYFWLVRR